MVSPENGKGAKSMILVCVQYSIISYQKGESSFLVNLLFSYIYIFKSIYLGTMHVVFLESFLYALRTNQNSLMSPKLLTLTEREGGGGADLARPPSSFFVGKIEICDVMTF